MGSRRRTFGVAVIWSFGALAACGQATTDKGQSISDRNAPQAPPAPPTPSASSSPATPAPNHPPPTPRPTPQSPQGAPRLIAPLSTAISTSTRPVFTWIGESGSAASTVDVCRDRACADVIVSFSATGSSGLPPQPLPAGVVFWRVSSATTGGRTSAVWELTIPARDSGRAGSWGSVPDFNGDGFGDLTVGVEPTGTATNSEVRYFPGGPQGLATTPAQSFTLPLFSAEEAGSAGDLDGDGFADLVIWNSPIPRLTQPQTPTVTVYRGGPAGLSSPVTFDGPQIEIGSQMRVLSAGDVNGDGYGDLLVGGTDVAQLFLGTPGGVNTTPAETLAPLPAATPSAMWPIGNGDFNGDGHPDAIISGVNGGQLYEGDGHTLVAQAGPSFGAFGGLAGDFNGDGFADVAAFDIFTGSPGGPVLFQGVAGEDFYQGVGDVNGDGFSDVLSTVSSLVGVPEGDRLYFGGTTACTSTDCPTVPLLVPGHTNGQLTALGAKGIGDVNGDGFADFVFFEPGAGSVYLFYGSPAGPPSNPSVTITAEQGFGFSVAGM